VSVRVLGRVRAANADANQLELAIINLAVNARDAMPTGGAITIEVRETTVEEGETDIPHGDYVCLSLIDTGEGMDEETLARATEPFFTTKGVGRGTGLGLSMVHGLAQQLSGQLRLKSRKGEGTTAELWLPVADRRAQKALAPSVEKARAEGAARAAAKSLVVLAVDDDVLVLMNTVAMLEDLGHTAIEAANGHEALQVLREREDVDVVVTDYAMPRMTGRELAAAIAEERPGIPVILATGYAELPPGAAIDAYRLSKPFGQEELRRAVVEASRT
jgi:CheY-like chemotaxis protein